MSGSALTLGDLQRLIAEKAWRDPAFEAEFVADPKGTFEKYLQQELPGELAIHAHYNSPDEIHFVVPRRPESHPDELTDEDLERVAGGETLMLSAMVTVSWSVVIPAALGTVLGAGWGKP